MIKVGDKVRILKRKPEWAEQSPNYNTLMTDFEGLEFVVKKITPLGNIDHKGYRWHPDWLEKVEVKSAKDLYALY